jgi:hypothetical protein
LAFTGVDLYFNGSPQADARIARTKLQHHRFSHPFQLINHSLSYQSKLLLLMMMIIIMVA